MVVASIVAQAGYGESKRPRIRYNAMEQGLTGVPGLFCTSEYARNWS
jgi:hypothetical protein